ncbi:MAG: exonuclease SbcCD subunit D C-terminal domain-containing protein [Rothia sp. (in: high G+C Gram-positive bacteria)]|nr:exonuclease SbcCD subunit D C-terminal domain-containing protein [Rothia sp. (in: high G+C Gram-positive bacteria)]
MRILHTSDWHLGRSFHGSSLHDLTEQVLEELLSLIQQEQIDLLLISGDVYDQAQPRTETVQLLDRTLTRLAEAGVKVIAISGNHDSAIRLGFASEILRGQGIYLVTSSEQVGQPIILEEQGLKVAFYPIPYLEPRPLASRWQLEASHQEVLAEAMRRCQQDAATRDLDASIVLAHCFAGGGSPSDSERDIRVGGVDKVDAQIFSWASYTALGHLHGRQKLSETVRYSGSLLAYSFSEEKHRKGAWILELGPGGLLEVRDYQWKTRLEIKSLRGRLEELLAPEVTSLYGQAFVRISLTDSERPAAALSRLREHYSHLQELYFEADNLSQPTTSSYQGQNQQASSQEICAAFFQHVRGRELTEGEEAYLQASIEAVRQERASA